MLSDEEREALRNFKSEYETCDHCSSDLIIELDDAEIILNLIEKQSKEIETLKNNNKDLLRKLRNRVKEVKKLEKYSLYKKEFSTLNKRIEKKEQEIKELKKQLIALTYKSSVKGSR